MQELNEELFHMFGYVKHENNDTETQFVDYQGKAKASSVDKINYYRKLNEKAFEKRLKTRHGELPKSKTVVHKDQPGTVELVTKCGVMGKIWITDMFNFDGV